MIDNDRSVGLNVRLAGPGSVPSVHRIRRVVAGSTPGPFACLLPEAEEVVLFTSVPGLGDLVGHTLSLPATDLRWEQHDVGTVGPPLMSRLVIWSTNGGLSIHEVEQVAGRLNVMECFSMATEELCKRLGFSPEDSRDMDFIKLMHFSSGVVTLMMKHCIVAQLVLLERGIFCDTINHWQMQPCPPCPSQLVNATLMQNSLIVLHESGHVYIFDLTTGNCQAHIDIPMYCRVRNPEIQRKDRPKIPFRVVAVSNGLEYIVALDDSKIAVYISLKDYFRIFPEHVINGGGSHEELAADVCSGNADNESIFDEDDICWSLKAALPFNADRSWNVQLTRLQEQQTSSSYLFSGSGFHWLNSQVSPVHLKKPRMKTSLDHLCDCRRDSIQQVSKSVLSLTSISPMTSAHVCFLAVGHTTALLAFTDNGDLTLLLWDISDGSLLPCFSVSPGIVVEMDDEDCPCLILTEQGLSMFILGLSHNELLSRLMVHGSPRLVDSLCLLNHWERCSVPLHALEAGLQNRQLDMLDFFLKSQEHLLDFGASNAQQDSRSSLSLSQLQNVYRLVPALQLLHRLVQESIAKEATNNFAEELLYRTHTFLHRQLRMLLTNYCQDTMPDKRVAECTQVLLGFIKDLRQFFRNITERELWNFSSEAEVDSVTVPQIASWENVSTRDVVKNAIICGCIPAAQAWLKSRRDNCGNLKCLKSLGVELVDAALQQRDMKTTCTLIGNLGFEVSDHLRKVCFYMEDNDLRDFLVETNEDMSFLNSEEQEVARFVQHVESLYNLTCHVVQPKTPATIRLGKYKEDCREPSVQCPLVNLLDTPCTLDHEADPMSLAWMLGLDEDVRQKILLDSGRLNDYHTFSADTLWYYLTSHHKQEDVHAWLENWLSGRESQRWPVLCTDIVATNTRCCSFFREEILDHMARKGCFLPSEISDMYSLVKRLAWTLGFTPQLSKVQNVNEFHGRFVRFCLEIGFPHILSLYLDHYRLNVEQCPELGDTELLKVYPWFNFLISIWQLQDKTATHVSDVFRASLANGRLLLSNEHGGIESMLLEGHTLLAAASLMYSPGGLDAATLQADEQLMKPALSPYPCLKAALFPQTSGTPCVTDISLYHLLQALDPFGPSRLYGWQATNTFAKQDSVQELPNFSQPFLKARPTTCQFLGFSYYLLHGRPSFAFVAFVQEGIRCGGISKSSVQDAGKEASMLALTNFDSPAVVASVVAFAEMLGLDRVMTQVNTRVANTILQNKLAEGGTVPEERQQLVARFLELAHGNTAGFSGVLLDLEEAIKVTLLADGIESSSMDAANRWEMAVQFCQIHGAELSEVFVRECARDNCWLPFITFIHRHHYPVHQVMSVVEDFPSPLREHISLAFSGLLDASVGHEGFNIFRSILDMRQGPRSWQELLQQAVKASIPILCVLATAYPGAEVVPCLCAWILASCECHPAGVDMVGKVANPAQCGLLELSKLLCEGLKRGEVCILITAFQLFLPDTHLLYLLQMFNLCTEHKDYHSAKDKLQAFTRGLDELKALGTHTSLSLPANWLEAQASVLLLILIRKSETQYQTFRLYQLLSESHSVLHSDVLDFKKLSQLAQILRHLDVPLGPAGLQDWGPEGLLLHCVHLVACLQERRYFVQARQVAAVMDLPCDDIVTNELFDGMQVLQEKEQWGYAQVRANFWKQCHEAFDSARTSPSHAASFFAARASEVVIDNSTSQFMTSPVNEPSSRGNAASILLLHEKLALLTLSGHWLGNGLTTEPSEMEIAEFKCWKCRLELQHSLEIGKISVSSTVDTTEDGNSLRQKNYAEQEEGCASFAMLSSKFSFDSHSLLSSPHYLKLSGLSSSNSFCRITNFQEKIFENNVADLLDKGCVLEAARVCHYFGVRFPDLEFALSCLALASCEANVTDLPEHARDVVQGYSASTPIPRPGKDNGCSLSSFVIVPSREDQVVVALETLTRACQHGKRFCQQVHNAYELAKELEVDFAEVWNGKSASLLTRVLRHENIDRVSRASLFVEIRGISTPTVTHLLADTIVEDLARERAPEGTRLVYLPSEGREAFGKLLKLCSEPAALGTILLQKASSLAGQEPTVMVEVLILAHECFTIICHVEGIIRTLLLAKHLTHHVLVPRELYPLMVCLLIGIGRYTDMVYILDLLHQYDQFELLLKNKMDLDGSLKTALLDYIKQNRPGDSEKYNMVALCFRMNREIAENLESAARTQLKLIAAQPWEKNKDLISKLQKVVTYFTDAAQSYTKESCPRQARTCIQMAKLVTLQLHFLKTERGIRIVNLTRDELPAIISALTKYYQVRTVAEAYRYSPCWAEVLHHHVVQNGNLAFLQEFEQHDNLTSNIFQDIVLLCKPDKVSLTIEEQSRLAKLLQHCPDVSLASRIAWKCGLSDFAQQLLKVPGAKSYIQDVLNL